jgi:hypothetical protein
MTKYESIPDTTMTPGSESEQRHSKMSLRAILIGGVAVSMLVVVALAVKSSTGGGATITTITNMSAATVELEDSAVPACTFEECYASNCNHDVAPFTCLFHNGGPHGGCSPTAWLEGTCTTQCDLSDCAELDIPDDTESCDQPCDKFCTNYEDRLCGADVPYQCTSGSAKFGCSKQKLEWTLRTSSDTCSSCCNTKSCK